MDSTPYGSQYYDTPNIERLARRSMRFTRAYAANPLCSPTRASILTGLYPARLHITAPAGHLEPLPPDQPLMPETGPPHQKMLPVQSRRYLPLEERTVAEAFRDGGYRTGFFGKWHLGRPEKYWPQYQGFDVNVGGGGYPGPPSYFSPYHIIPLPDGPPGEHIADRLTDEMLSYIDSVGDDPYLLFMWHYSVHAPYQAKEDYIEEHRDVVDPTGRQDDPVMAGMIRSMDESLGRLLDKLDADGTADNTIIVFFSDNGGNEYDRVGDEQWLPTNNDPLRSGKGSIYEGGVRVPMMVCWPGVVQPDSETDATVCSIDFYPTLMEMAGLTPEPDKLLDGESIVPVLQGRGGPERDALFCHYPHGPKPATGRLAQPCTAVWQGRWKLIRLYETGDGFPDQFELYDLEEDIGETTNLAEREPEKVRELDALIDGFLAETGAIVPLQNPNWDPNALSEGDGWRPSGDTVLKQAEGALVIDSTGGDPFVHTDDVPEVAGDLVARFRMRSDSAGQGQFFYADAKRPNFGPPVRLNFDAIHDGEWHEYEVSFTTQGNLVRLRIDPSTAAGQIEIDWARVETAAGDVAREWTF